ncbi:DUF1289 domain-containing protein [Suttonella ornithocola]|uniref:Predicted Fe-S protein n=1 Tax=Suttonella ornithocola TaxID=279832 RepID=A0A380MTW1_9GAMM|nr:DUF1289 domain-containing protein [Suttonella ornithocola]SUO95363.1 Predicted Fe-S protein [Suttonella ornithocola]
MKAEQLEIFKIENPCKRQCETGKNGICTTCYRNREERFTWNQLNDTQKSDILKRITKRKRAILAKLRANQIHNPHIKQPTYHQKDLFNLQGKPTYTNHQRSLFHLLAAVKTTETPKPQPIEPRPKNKTIKVDHLGQQSLF